MKVYIVTSGDYSGYHIEAVFDSKNQAAMYCAANPYDRIMEEFDTEEHVFSIDRRVYTRWSAEFRDGGYVGAVETGYSYTREPPKIDRCIFGNRFETVSFCCEVEKSPEKVKKIACDLYAQLKYNKAMEDNP